MKKKKLVWIFVCFALSFFTAGVTLTQAGATQTEIIFQPGPGLNDGTDDGSINAGKDAFFYACGTWSGTSDTLYGYARSTCNECNAKGYIQFNISTLPSIVDKVYLGVTHHAHSTCYSMCEANFYFYPLLTEWNEMSLPTTPPQEGGPIFGPLNITVPNDFGKKEYDVTEIYRKWKNGTVPNNGLVIYSPDTGCLNAAAQWSVHSSDSLEITKRPYLKIIAGSLARSLAAGFAGLGLYIYNLDSAAWSQITSLTPENLIYLGSTLYVDFGAIGLWKWDGAAWTELTSANPENMVTNGSTLYVDFGASYGLWKWDGAAWTRLTSINPENMVADGSILYVGFGASYGLWKWDGAVWSQLTGSSPAIMAISN